MTEHPFGLFVSTGPITGQTDIPCVLAEGDSSAGLIGICGQLRDSIRARL